ncbi:hypothetical protein HanIR_Chr04g0168011 [Helianthus annuus]|nr:hypothetical protein HanIR_Chr04g0168011 [Helianthus annuus]
MLCQNRGYVRFTNGSCPIFVKISIKCQSGISMSEKFCLCKKSIILEKRS